MSDRTHPDSGSTHIIRYALEMGLLWIDGDGRDKAREALDALDTLEAQLESIGAGGVSGPLMGQLQAPLGGRWYMVTHDGAATLCINQEDAQAEAVKADRNWPHMGPHRAVQLVEAASVAASAGSEPVVQAEAAVLCWVNEDELPAGLTQEAYSALFPHSKVDGVRMFPIFGPTAQAAPAAVAGPVEWRELAARVMDALADAQEQTNSAYPAHASRYPAWEAHARWLRWHADMFRTGKPVGSGAGQPAVLAALAAASAAQDGKSHGLKT